MPDEQEHSTTPPEKINYWLLGSAIVLTIIAVAYGWPFIR